MPVRTCFAVLLFGAAAGCGAKPEPAPAAPPDEALTPELAKDALLRMMRSKPGQDLGWFKGDAPDEMAKMAVEPRDDGWYDWTGAFRFNPSQAAYTFVVRPQPGARACLFEYKGSFVKDGGRWAATPPELVRTALQPGE